MADIQDEVELIDRLTKAKATPSQAAKAVMEEVVAETADPRPSDDTAVLRNAIVALPPRRPSKRRKKDVAE